MVLRRLFEMMSPNGPRARLSVLIFHRVLPEVDPLFPDEMHAQRFDQVCEWLADWFNVLPLDVAVGGLRAGSLPARAACITFDDGYADNHDVALPILLRHGLTSTFFIATGFLDGGRMWNDTIIESIRGCNAVSLDLSAMGLGHHALGSIADRRAAIATLIDRIKYLPVAQRIAATEQLAELCGVCPPQDMMMTSLQVQALRRAGMLIGAHTVSHPILARLEAGQALHEIEASKVFLEGLLGEPVNLFAYPNGKPGADYSPTTTDIVRRLGFHAAVSTANGISRQGDDLFQIRRFTPWDRNRVRFAARLLMNMRVA